jgi:type II secretory pathway component PulF
MIASDNSRTTLSAITADLARTIARGQTFGQALHKYTNTFSFFSISLITIGERSGTLPESLEYIAIELKKKHELRTQIMSALIYPCIVIVATIAITVFLIVYIFPKIVPIFLSLKTELPWSTQFLMGVSNFLSNYGWYLLMIIFIFVCAAPFIFRIRAVAYMSAKLVLRLPIVGHLCRNYNVAQMARTLGLLLCSDVPITQALDITATSTHNIVFKNMLRSIQPIIATGKNFSVELRQYPFLIPPLMVQMVQAGEQTGTMPTTLAYVAELFESDIRDTTKNLTTVVEPLLMLGMGLVVGFIAISIITPIYGITQNLHQ